MRVLLLRQPLATLTITSFTRQGFNLAVAETDEAITMKRTWIHIVLYLGCVALLLLQGRRIQQLQQIVAEDHAREQMVIHYAKYYEGEQQAEFDNCIHALRNSIGRANPKKLK
jgi:hypothetical protein